MREVKASFSAVVDDAEAGCATVVTRYGEKVAVVLGFADHERLMQTRPSFADLRLAFPEADGLGRDPAPARAFGA